MGAATSRWDVAQRPTEAAAEKWGAGAQFAGGKRSAPTEPAGETDAPAALVAFGKRRRVEKASCGRLFAGNPRRGFPDRAGGSA